MIRVSDNAAVVSKLEDTGMRPKLAERIQELVTAKQGLFICAGTPASGKTATVYTCIRAIDRFQHNILTLEDVIEHPLDNVQQMVVYVKKGEQYPERLRSVCGNSPTCSCSARSKSATSIPSPPSAKERRADA